MEIMVPRVKEVANMVTEGRNDSIEPCLARGGVFHVRGMSPIA